VFYMFIYFLLTPLHSLTTMFINKPLNLYINMGRIKTTFIKRKTKELLKKHGDSFTTDFSKNKEIAGRHIEVQSKKLRNVIAGYMTRLKRRE